MAKMETKNPKTRLLFTLLLLSVFAFVGIKFALDSYWSMTTEAYAADILPPNSQLADLRAKQKKDLESSPTPINVAMQDIAVKGRGSSETITPQQSTDLDPMRGWSKMKKEIVEPPPPPPPPMLAPELAADGGVIVPAGDGGVLAPPAPSGDAGVRAATDAAAPPAPKNDGGP